MSAPRTRASFAQSIQQEILKLSPSTSNVIRDRAGPAWESIARSLPLDWIEEEPYNAMTNAARHELGDVAFRDMFRRLGRRVVKSAAFQPAVEALVKIVGLSPHALLKFAPKARESVVRNSGTLVYSRGDERCAKLILRDFPASTYRSGTTMLLLSGTWLGLTDFAGVGTHASVDCDDVDLEQGRTTFVVRW